MFFSRFPVFGAKGHGLERRESSAQGKAGPGADYGQGPGPLPAGIYKLSCQMMPSIAGEIGDLPAHLDMQISTTPDGRPRGWLHYSSKCPSLSSLILSTRLADRLRLWGVLVLGSFARELMLAFERCAACSAQLSVCGRSVGLSDRQPQWRYLPIDHQTMA